MLAEESHSHPDFIIQLNPDVEWKKLKPGEKIQVPRVPPITIPSLVASIRIRLSSRTLQVYGYDDQLLFHCPVSIAQRVEKRPSGELRVSVTARDPNYTFNPEILSAVAQRGIHGTPEPEKVGRTESHGCFRVVNWDATTLLGVAEIDLPVYVEP
jgi:lipoprotein-anchoring transpeptidase ErfK/SrfK